MRFRSGATLVPAPPPNTQTYGATNYLRGYRRKPLSLPDHPDITKAFARAIELEVRLKREKAAAEKELAKLEAQAVKKPPISAAQPIVFDYRKQLRDRISQYEKQLQAAKNEEIALRLRALYRERMNNNVLLALIMGEI